MSYASLAGAFCLQKPFLFLSIKCRCLRIKIQRAHWEKKILSVLRHLCLNNTSFPSKCTVYSQSVCVTQCYKLCPERDNLSNVTRRLGDQPVSLSLLCLQWHTETKKLYSITGWWVATRCYGTEQLNTGRVESSNSPPDYSLQWDWHEACTLWSSYSVSNTIIWDGQRHN